MKFRQYEKYASKSLQKKHGVVFFVLGLTGKVGQVCSLIKQQQEQGSIDLTEQIQEALGDSLWYLTLLSKKYGGLEEVVGQNLEKLADCYEEEAGQSKKF